jgi:hypothetical protein
LTYQKPAEVLVELHELEQIHALQGHGSIPPLLRQVCHPCGVLLLLHLGMHLGD